MKPEEKVPSQQDQIKHLKEQMPLKRLQVELQRLNTDFVELKVREFEAINRLQQIDQIQKDAENDMMRDIIKHVVTQEDLDINPELAQANITVGQEIGIPKEIYYTDQVKLAKKVEPKIEGDDKPTTTSEAFKQVVEESENTLKVVKD